MTTAPDPFDAGARKQLQAMIVANGVAPARALEIVDLACHAAESSVGTLFDTRSRTGDFGIRMMAIEVALQLARARMEAVLERTHDLGKRMGCPQYGGEVGLRL